MATEDAVRCLRLFADSFARGADEHPELFLRDMHFGAEIGGERAEPPCEPDRQWLQHRFLHPLALPADALTQQLDDLDRDLRLALEMAQEILTPQHEQFGRLAGGRVRRAALAIEHCDLAKEIAGAHEIQRQPAAVGRAGLDAALAAAYLATGIPGLAFLEQDFTEAKVLGVAEIGNPLQFVDA